MRREHAGPAAADPSFPTTAGPAERLRFLLGYAVLAPSRHNTQPWMFEIEGDEVRVYVDAARALPAADPDGRQLLMACGAALVNLRVAAHHFGHATSAEILPGYQTRVWGYNGTFPGPTFDVQRGRQIFVRHENQLPAHPTLLYTPNTSVHLHGSASLPQYDGYASDVTFQIK
jgi:FtsP/CotA-like multicopper oxidase with cupredoxin domain